MVLRLFSKSAKTQPKDPIAPTQPGSDAGPAELAQAARNANSGKDRQALINRITDSSTLKDLAAAPGCLPACADQLAQIETLETALSIASTPKDRFELAIHTHNAELRAAQINQLLTEESLVELEHASRSKNKACNRMARERLDALRRARVSATQAAELTTQLANNAQRLEEDAHIAARFEALAERHAAAAEQHASSQQLLADFKEQAPAITPMPLPPNVAVNETADEGPDFTSLSSAFSKLEEQMRTGSKAADLADAMTTAATGWREAIATATPDGPAIDKVSNCSALYESLRNCEALMAERGDAIAVVLSEKPKLGATEIIDLPRDQLDAAWQSREFAKQQSKAIAELNRGLAYPHGIAAPTVLAELNARKGELNAIIDASKNRQKQTEDAFKDQVKRLGQALDAGELKRAEAARGEARVLQDALPTGSANDTRKRYGSLIANMQNLRDWQHFATDPKREELCERMGALADTPKEPDEQADLVKELRGQWNALGGKGPREIAKRFDEAAARAFEPCRLHYAQLAEARGANLEIRKNILAQLETFVSSTDWATADLAGARNILNSARTEWRNAFPVERHANRSLEKGFKAATDTLYEKLQDGWSGNLAVKEKLVVQAEALLASEAPLPERLDAAKRLQQDWKQAGPVPRGPDQKLWKRLRSACDALFSARDEERTQLQAQYSAQQNTANARLDEFEKDLAATAPDALDRSLLNAMKRDLDEIENLDRNLVKRARELEDQFKNKLKDKAFALQQQKLTQLCDLDVLATACEIAGQPVSAEIGERDPRFSARSPGDEHAHLDLVLEAETQAGIESPATDSQRRLELQVQQLNAGMNSGARKASSGMELAERWCALQGSSLSDSLRDRLFAAASALLTAR